MKENPTKRIPAMYKAWIHPQRLFKNAFWCLVCLLDTIVCYTKLRRGRDMTNVRCDITIHQYARFQTLLLHYLWHQQQGCDSCLLTPIYHSWQDCIALYGRTVAMNSRLAGCLLCFWHHFSEDTVGKPTCTLISVQPRSSLAIVSLLRAYYRRS